MPWRMADSGSEEESPHQSQGFRMVDSDFEEGREREATHERPPSRSEIVKALNRRLREAGLKNLTAHGGKGTAWGWIDVVPKHRAGEPYRDFTWEEREKLGQIYGSDPGMTNALVDEMDDWALKLGMINREDYRESPWRQLVRENRD